MVFAFSDTLRHGLFVEPNGNTDILIASIIPPFCSGTVNTMAHDNQNMEDFLDTAELSILTHHGLENWAGAVFVYGDMEDGEAITDGELLGRLYAEGLDDWDGYSGIGYRIDGYRKYVESVWGTGVVVDDFWTWDERTD